MKKAMKLAIMQPYFFPYIGYFQIMAAVDKYVVYDDVNYIKGGRINRNTVLIGGKAQPVNLLLSGASPNKLINEVGVLHDKVGEKKLLRTLEMNYSKAPCFGEVFPLLEEIVTFEEKNLAAYLFNSFEKLNGYMGIDTELIMSSDIEKDNSLRAADKVYHICELLGASEYFNSVGGQELYSKEAFAERGITLHFLKTDDGLRYEQFGGEFVPNLSIIDVLMFNTPEQVRELLTRYTLI